MDSGGQLRAVSPVKQAYFDASARFTWALQWRAISRETLGAVEAAWNEIESS